VAVRAGPVLATGPAVAMPRGRRIDLRLAHPFRYCAHRRFSITRLRDIDPPRPEQLPFVVRIAALKELGGRRARAKLNVC